jgi:hypothetical protein
MANRTTAISANVEKNPDCANGARIGAPRSLHPGYELASDRRANLLTPFG